MSKGEETKNRILFVARDLFYEYGFHKTTARMISEKANTNLGLLNYYFKNKNEMGLIIYSSIRDRFDELIAEYFPDMDELTLFLFSSTLELYLCITNENACDIYTIHGIYKFHHEFEQTLYKIISEGGALNYTLILEDTTEKIRLK